MVSHYKRKTERGSYGSAAFREALDKIAQGSSLNSVSKDYGITRQVLRRHQDKKVRNPGEVALGRFIVSLNEQYEQTFVRNGEERGRLDATRSEVPGF